MSIDRKLNRRNDLVGELQLENARLRAREQSLLRLVKASRRYLLLNPAKREPMFAAGSLLRMHQDTTIEAEDMLIAAIAEAEKTA